MPAPDQHAAHPRVRRKERPARRATLRARARRAALRLVTHPTPATNLPGSAQ
ncbi:hypothetical protein [Streptomyces albireticuli]|uniref:Uncharacterized protein n=1 Tax=Streptomyces albireticuli TaxID=1940 RepID=A0A1Z2LBG4_9ACTN|nr:hypothetical protein [Streptomyces albireticuli]ARZ71634.1 hypothetical protein SMD11_6058 [Streptomyces albireticuli]MCD9193522.1 hypothetical protein [Streptomyces albireticuli]